LHLSKLPKKVIKRIILERSKPIDVAKEKILDRRKSVREVGYELGFKHPAHFSRVFKKHVGHSPNEYRSSLN